MIARRALSDPTAIAYYLSVEQYIAEAKSETGLDEYEVRYWHSWHRHITLSMMAHAWLAAVRYQSTAKKDVLNPFWPS